MPQKIVFTVYEAANGYFAETSHGALVIGTTLSEVCTAAQGKVAEEQMTGEGEVPVDESARWLRVGV